MQATSISLICSRKEYVYEIISNAVTLKEFSPSNKNAVHDQMFIKEEEEKEEQKGRLLL